MFVIFIVAFRYVKENGDNTKRFRQQWKKGICTKTNDTKKNDSTSFQIRMENGDGIFKKNYHHAYVIIYLKHFDHGIMERSKCPHLTRLCHHRSYQKKFE